MCDRCVCVFVCVLLVVFVRVFVLQTFSWLSANRISGAAVALLSFHLISSPLSPLPPPLPLALLPLFPPHPPTPPLTSCHVLFNMMRTKRGLNLITQPLYTTFFFLNVFLLFCVSGFLFFSGFSGCWQLQIQLPSTRAYPSSIGLHGSVQS